MSETFELGHCNMCDSCSTKIITFFNDTGDLCEPKEHYVTELTVDEPEEEICCEVCGVKLEFDEEYYEVMIPREIQLAAADVLSSRIGGCEQCHGQQLRAYEHSYNSDPFETDPIDIGGSSYTVEGFLELYGVPESLTSIFTELIRCKKCGYGRYPETSDNPYAGIFGKDDDLYTREEVDGFYGLDDFNFEEFSEFTKKYNEDISTMDLYSLKETLLRNPMLAFKNATGKAIYNVLKAHFDAKGYFSLKPNEVKLYRGRTRTIDSGDPFPIEKMWAAPQGKTSHGRFNFIGASVLYVTDQENAIPYEINPTHDQLIDVATFEIIKEELILFDLGSFDESFQGFFNEVNEESNTLKSAYLLPNYIGACCSEIGYDGLKYTGVHKLTQNGSYINYALFDMEPGIDLKAASEEVITFRPKITIELELEQSTETEDIQDTFPPEVEF